MADKWTDEELTACMEAYLLMLENEANNIAYNKAGINRQLREGALEARNRGSIEFRMANFSSFFASMDRPYVQGYKPRGNIGAKVTERIVNILAKLEGRAVQIGLEAVINPLKSVSKPTGQGFSQSAVDRKVIELQAMQLATEYLEEKGYSCKDTSSNNPYDILATKYERSLKVEVKGTTTTNPQHIFMTKNEVSLHSEEKGKTVLIIVHSILLDRSQIPPVASNGSIEAIFGWDIAKWDLEPLSFKVSRK